MSLVVLIISCFHFYSQVGELHYLAPEVLLAKQQLSDWHTALKQVDVYAFSLVLWEICRRCSHFYEEGRYSQPLYLAQNPK